MSSPQIATRVSRIGLLLALWLACDRGLSLFNAAVFQFAHFNYPIMLCALHFVFHTFFTSTYLSISKGGPSAELDEKGTNNIRAFSTLFMAAVVLENLCLRYVSVSFLQVFHSTVPAMVIPLSALILQEYFSTRVKLCLVPMLLGVALAACGDIEFNLFGACLCFIGYFFAALKLVLSNKFLSGIYSVHPLALLKSVSPVAFLQLVLLSVYLGEAKALINNCDTYLNFHDLSLIFGSAVISLLFHWVSFEVCKATSALTMSIVETVRDSLLVFLSVFIFGNVTPVSTAGISLAMTGSALYSYVRIMS